VQVGGECVRGGVQVGESVCVGGVQVRGGGECEGGE
jgi:hypothetical protein